MINEEIKNRLNWFERYYEKHSNDNEQFSPNYNAVKEIRKILIKESISIDDINIAVEIYNQTTSKPHHEGSGWFDLRLHLCHISRTYGQELEMNKENQLVKAR